MKRITLCLTIVVSALTVRMIAQTHVCGNTAADGRAIKEALFLTRAEMKDFVRTRNAVTYVPVRFWMVANNSGEERPSEAGPLRALCLLNENYEDQDIQFYLKEFKNYNNSTVYSNPQGFNGISAISNQMELNYNAINVFVVDDAGGGAAAYYQLPYGPNGNDWIVSGRNYVDDISTLTHEFGHFFTLPHPFNGWEDSGGWNLAEHGNPVGTLAPDDETPNEFASGSNCNTAGDGICDTPADYMFPFPGSNGCTYNLNVKDPNNVLISPVINNFMNYGSCTSYFFTDDQKDEISNSLFSNARNYVRPNYTPNTAAVTGTATIIAPLSSELVETYNSVHLEWTAVPGADRYFVEINSIGDKFRRYITNTNEMLATELPPNKNHALKVIAFNEYSTCANTTPSRFFETGDVFSDSAEIPGLTDWNTAPNPVGKGGILGVNVESAQGLKATVNVVSVTGQTVFSAVDYLFPGGISTLEIPTDGIAAGVYFVSLKSENGLQTKRVSIMD